MTEDKESELRKRMNKCCSLIQSTMESSTDGIVIFNNDGHLFDFNKRFVALWSVPMYLLKRNNTNELIEYMASQIENPSIFQNLSAIPGSETGKVFFDRIKLNNGLVLECHSRPQYFNEKMVARVWSFHDITEYVDMKSQIAYLVTHDQLTGLASRYLMIDRLELALNMAKRNSMFCAVFFINIDRFKEINLSLGNEIGDKILIEFSLRLKGTIRTVDFVARSHSIEYENRAQNAEEDTEMSRIGGDEFLIIVHLRDKLECAFLYDRIEAELSKPFIIDNHAKNITFSMGISIYPTDGKNASELLRCADIAMNQAKSKGGGCYQFYST